VQKQRKTWEQQRNQTLWEKLRNKNPRKERDEPKVTIKVA